MFKLLTDKTPTKATELRARPSFIEMAFKKRLEQIKIQWLTYRLGPFSSWPAMRRDTPKGRDCTNTPSIRSRCWIINFCQEQLQIELFKSYKNIIIYITRRGRELSSTRKKKIVSVEEGCFHAYILATSGVTDLSSTSINGYIFPCWVKLKNNFNTLLSLHFSFFLGRGVEELKKGRRGS